MLSTTETRLMACARAAVGKAKAPTLATLQRRVERVHAGETKSARQLKRSTAQLIALNEKIARQWECNPLNADLALHAIRTKAQARIESMTFGGARPESAGEGA